MYCDILSHGIHLTYKLMKQELENDMIIFCFPTTADDPIQPLDVGISGIRNIHDKTAEDRIQRWPSLEDIKTR